MEEDIDIRIIKKLIKTMQDEKGNCTEQISIEAIDYFAKSLENLINKYKEQEKMIELMNEYILNEYISPEICNKHTPEDCYADIYDDNACRECVLEYFRKKAKGE